ncbi:MAG: ATP-binding cassette domain-containing protein [Spirochaetes bacterium]|nr:ATP-binding cassette domain-containing protein [Spirochaetota bacterium]
MSDAAGRKDAGAAVGAAVGRVAAPLLFEVCGLRAAFDGNPVLEIDDLRIAEGGVTVLVGENGSGKTTLLRLLNGLLDPVEGSILFRGLPLAGEGRAAVRSRSVMVHQLPLLFRGTVAQNVGYGLRIRGVARAKIADRVAGALEQVGLPGFAPRRATALSGGEMQRVCLARALALESEVLLLDEPTANVDPDSRSVVERVVRDRAQSGVSVVMSTHAMETAYRLCDTLLHLESGRIVEPEENILKGAVERSDEQFTQFRADGAAAGSASEAAGALILCPARQGEFRVAVLPMNELILSRDPLDSSARNRLRGRVTAVEPLAGLLRVSVDCGVVLKALVTPSAAVEIGVAVGRDFVVTFKASAVRLY